VQELLKDFDGFKDLWESVHVATALLPCASEWFSGDHRLQPVRFQISIQGQGFRSFTFN
jgi:hypothetical protein